MPTTQFTNWSDFRVAGIEMLTGEACSLMLRVLCDVTDKGHKLICRALGLDPTKNKLGEPWNGGTKDNPHVGSIMLSSDWLPVLAIFAALDQPGTIECYHAYKDGQWAGTYGFAAADMETKGEWIECMERFGYKMRRYSYNNGPQAVGDRNIHTFTGRVT